MTSIYCLLHQRSYVGEDRHEKMLQSGGPQVHYPYMYN